MNIKYSHWPWGQWHVIPQAHTFSVMYFQIAGFPDLEENRTDMTSPGGLLGSLLNIQISNLQPWISNTTQEEPKVLLCKPLGSSRGRYNPNPEDQGTSGTLIKI